jgi:hypothetical protein
MTDTAAATPATPRVTPTASQSVRIPWGDWAEQLIMNETHVVQRVAEAGFDVALGMVPIGAVIKAFVGPQIVDQYVEMAMNALGGLVKGQGLTVDTSNFAARMVTNLILTNEPKVAAWLGNELEPLIAAALAKIGVKL